MINPNNLLLLIKKIMQKINKFKNKMFCNPVNIKKQQYLYLKYLNKMMKTLLTLIIMIPNNYSMNFKKLIMDLSIPKCVF